MNVCFELKLAMQVLRQRPAAGRRAAALSRHRGGGEAVRDVGERKGRAPLRGERWETWQGAVWKGREEGENYETRIRLTPCMFLLCYGLAALTFDSASSLH